MNAKAPLAPSPLDQMQHWTRIMGHMQQLIMERSSAFVAPASAPKLPSLALNMERLVEIQAQAASDGIAIWQRFLANSAGAASEAEGAVPRRSDRRFSDARWHEHPVYDLIRQTYFLMSDTLMGLADSVDGLDGREKEKLRFITRSLIDAASPTNFPLTNPQVIDRTIETNGENLLAGLEHMLNDLERGQLTHTDGSGFELGVNVATTPGKVIHETPLYQLIQYEPTTEKVLETPLVIFPPWINRFYILDLSPQKSFVRWAVDQGITVFMVSWKSADASMSGIGWDDYVLRGQIDAIDTVRDLLEVPSVHTIGYCVAGTTLAMTLAYLAARGEAEKIASATFLTAQVDFSAAGDLSLFVDDDQLAMLESLVTDGFLDGRYMAATFNLLRGNDLIWSYVVNNYLLGQDYPPFDLLFWNGDTTNLPAMWHRSYLSQLYRDNLLVKPGQIMVAGVPIDLSVVQTPAYVQAGVEDHIAPAHSVWRIKDHFSGPLRFVLAGSGHIAGVVNPPASGKYQYWTGDAAVNTLEAFREKAVENKGSWWPDWFAWVEALDDSRVSAKKARKPGKGKLAAIEDAPGRYVRER